MLKLDTIEVENPNFDFEVNCKAIEVFELPETMMIGKTVRCSMDDEDDNPIEAMWDVFENGWIRELGSVPRMIANAYFGSTFDYRSGDNTYLFMVGIMAPAGTLVPEGFESFKLPASKYVKGIREEWNTDTDDRLSEYGYKSGGSIWFHAELIVDGEKEFDANGKRIGRYFSIITEIDPADQSH